MLKAIFAKDVKEKDIILLPGGERHRIRFVDQRGNIVRLGIPGGQLDFKEYDIVGLGRRPWPEGMTEEWMLFHIRATASNLPPWDADVAALRKLDDDVHRLREAIEAYELGRPEVPNLSLTDRHLIP